MASSSTQAIPKIYTLDQIEEAIASPSFNSDLIAAIQDGFSSYSTGKFNACPIQTMGAPPMAPFVSSTEAYAAQTCVKSGYLTGATHYVIKVASGGHSFQNSGLMQLYSQLTGKLEAILLDEGILTELRTAAAGAVAAKHLAPKDIQSIGMMGTGVQARYQLRLLKSVTDCRNVLVWGKTPQNVQAFVQDMSREGWNVKVAKEPNDLLDACQVVVTTTSAREAVLGVNYEMKNGEGLHISCIGADAPGKQELDVGLVVNADLLVADSLLQTQERGEFQHALAQGVVKTDDVVELGNLVGNKDLRRKEQDDNRITIFDSSGVAVQDCVVAKMVHDALLNMESSD